MRFEPFYSQRRPFHPCDAKISYDGRFRASADEKKKERPFAINASGLFRQMLDS